MKMIIFIALFFAQSIVAAPAALKISRISQPENLKHRKESVYFLSEEGGALSCQTLATPRHRIKVKGLTLGYIPVLKQNEKKCDQLLEWGERKFCYVLDQDFVVDEMIRQCANF